MASIAAFVYFWSSAYEVSGGCATDTLYPSFLRMSATRFQPEPSAKAPCTRTTFLMGCFTTVLLCGKDPFGSVDFRCRRPGCRDRKRCLVLIAWVSSLPPALSAHKHRACMRRREFGNSTYRRTT